ncbi:MAG TPA: arginine--tRNA ligase, partial [Thermodesulfobacteriota bacterium]|nr:arginine--tRNA ligase [Thermodesulfobacteriota bacterium]
MRQGISDIIREALLKARSEGLLKSAELPNYSVESSRKEEFGDYSTNAAMLLAPLEKKAPRQIAEVIRERIAAFPDVEKCEVAGPGFINIFLRRSYWLSILEDIIRQGSEFGRSKAGAGKKVQVEFVSANPTGPLHIGHGRGAAVGDTLARVLDAAGYEVVKEYYINDAGRQVQTLGESVRLRADELDGKKVEFPQDYYKGDYVKDIAKAYREYLAGFETPSSTATVYEFACEKMLERIKSDLKDFRVEFDRWQSERELHESGAVTDSIAALVKKGVTKEEEGAL